MTKRSRLYFKFKWAYKKIATAAGRAMLAEKGLYPVSADVTNTIGLHGQYEAYFIDAKGNILGTTIKISPVTLAILKPQQAPTHYNVKFEFADPSILNNLQIDNYQENQ